MPMMIITIDDHHHDDAPDDRRDDGRDGRRSRPPGAPKTGRTATIPQKLILATSFMTLNRYLGESTIFLGGDGGVPASQHRAALVPTAVMLSITTSIIIMMTRMTVAMMIVEAAGAGPPVQQRRDRKSTRLNSSH